MSKIIFATILLATLIEPVNPQGIAKETAGDFAKLCKEPDFKDALKDPSLSFGYGNCLGYFDGLLVSNRLFYQMKRGDPLFCPPNGVTPNQGAKVFLKYIADHPEKLHETPAQTTIVALTLAFPCAATKPK